jgi:hypothetical protein
VKVFKLKVRQGTAFITALSKGHAEAQRRTIERDLQRYWVRAQAMIRPGVFAFGSAAKAQCGVKVFSCAG